MIARTLACLLVACIASAQKSAPKTAAESCRTSRFAVATNLGMFNDDHRTHTGYLRNGKHINSRRWNIYRSALVLRPTDPSLAPSLWIDLDGTNRRPSSIATTSSSRTCA